MYNKMKAPGDKRPTWRHGVIQVHVTRACDLSCIGCTQGSNLAGKPVIMPVDQFREACESLEGYFGVVGMFGGNPTMHPQFEELCKVMQETVPFEQRGLWSNNLRGYGKLCRETFNPAVSNLNVHTATNAYEEMKRDWPECKPIGLKDSRHSPPYVALKDIEDLTDEKRWELINNCDINQYWSAMLCSVNGELKAYFCELAGAQAMLHNDSSTGLTPKKGWWKLPIEAFDNQIRKHCFDCGVPLKGIGDLAVEGKVEYVSKTHLPIYKLKRPQNKEIRVVSKLSDLDGFVPRATDYIANGGLKMSSNVKVMIGLPTAEMARQAKFYDYFNMINRPDGTILSMSHGQSPASNRNLIIKQALEQNCTHVFFIDDDICIPPDALMKLLSHDKDIVSGLYLMRNFPHAPIAFNVALNDGKCRFKFLNPEETGLIEVVNFGLGCVLIKTDVFRKMQQPWIRIGQLSVEDWNDDIDFFNRAREAGYKLYLDLDIRCGHMGTVTIWPDYNEQNKVWLTVYDTQGAGHAAFHAANPIQLYGNDAYEKMLEDNKHKIIADVSNGKN